MVDLPFLPPPTSGSAEVRFRRLLHSCQVQLQSQRGLDQGGAPTTSQPDGLGAAGVSPIKLKGYVDALHDQLADLERSSAAPQAMLEAYRLHVRALAAQLPPLQLPPYCRNLKGSSTSMPSIPKLPLASMPFTGSALSGVNNLSAATMDKLTQHEQLQDSLTSELAGMAAALKQGTLGVQSAVRHRGQVLEGTETAMDDSVARAKAVAARSKEQVKRGSGSLCLTILILLVVCGAFTGMVVWIKFTSLLGMGRAIRRGREEL